MGEGTLGLISTDGASDDRQRAGTMNSTTASTIGKADRAVSVTIGASDSRAVSRYRATVDRQWTRAVNSSAASAKSAVSGSGV